MSDDIQVLVNERNNALGKAFEIRKIRWQILDLNVQLWWVEEVIESLRALKLQASKGMKKPLPLRPQQIG